MKARHFLQKMSVSKSSCLDTLKFCVNNISVRFQFLERSIIILNKAIKYRLYPTDEQAIMFTKTFGCVRKIYNMLLSDKIDYYKANKKMLKKTPAEYKKLEKYSFLKEVDSLALANARQNLDTAYNNFFRKRAGFPKFKTKHKTANSYTTNNQKGTIAILKKAIKLPKVGIVKAVIHRLPPMDWILKSATVSQTKDGKYYVSILFEYKENIGSTVIPYKTIGLDYASNGLYVDDMGRVGTNHKYYRESYEKLAKEQRKLSRKVGSKKGETKSNNYIKQLRKVNRIHRKIANQRQDNLHKISAEITNQYDVVCVESLNMRAMSNKGFGNGKATMDNGYGMFLNMLEYKLKDKGKYFVKVDKWFRSSQICCRCGQQHKEMKDLSIRIIRCDCGLTISRDQNAAINIKKEGLRLLGILPKAA